MSNIALYKGGFQYNLANVFIEKMGKGFQALGHNIIYLNIAEGRDNDFKRLRSGNIDYAIAFNAINLETFFLFCRDAGIKYTAILIDHPYYHLQRISDIDHITTYDLTHYDYLKKIFGESKKIALLHHGGDCAEKKSCKKYEDREIPILFPGTFSNPNYYFEQLKSYSNPIMRHLFLESIELIINNDSIPLETIIARLASSKGIDIESSSDIYKEFTAQLAPLDCFMRAHKRLQTLLELDKNDIPVTIYGNHWPTDLFKNHIIKGTVKYNKIVQIMGDSKIVLNMPFFPNGSHERLFTAALNGAIPLTDYNPYVHKVFGENTLLFRFTELNQISRVVNEFWTDKARQLKMSENCQRIAQSHTWEKRAEELLTIFKEWDI